LARAHRSLASAWGDAAVIGGNFALRFDGNDLFARVLTVVCALQRRLGYSTATPRFGYGGRLS